MKYNKSGFTLIEILVAISILSIIMVSVFTTFILAGDVNNRVEASRVIHENIKHLTESLSEDIRKNEITGIQGSNIASSCDLNFGTQEYKQGSKLCTDNGAYYLARLNGNTWIREDNCDIDTNCSIVLNTGSIISPITNTWISFQDLSFTLSNTNPKRVQLNFTARPAIGKGIKPKLIESNIIEFQTTFSQRIYDEYK